MPSKNSASSRVKMSFVTAAMEYFSRRARQSASIRAVFPDPTGLVNRHRMLSSNQVALRILNDWKPI